jgi:hypothetical protein
MQRPNRAKPLDKEMQGLGHITKETVELYRRKQLAAAELLAAQAHAAGCEECRARLAHALALDAAFTQMRAAVSAQPDSEDEPEHLSYEQLAGLVDDALDPVAREIADSHLAVCADCAADANDLRRYQAINAAAPPEVARADNVAPTNAASVAAAPALMNDALAPVKNLWRRLTAFSFMPSAGALAPAATLAAVVVIALFGLWFFSRGGPEFERNVTPDSHARRDSDAATQNAATNANAAASAADARGPENALSQVAQQTRPVGPQSQQKQQRERPPRRTQKSAAGNLAAEPRALQIALNDGGGPVLFDERGVLRGLEALPPAAFIAVRRSIETQRVETPPTLAALASGTSGVLMSNANTAGTQSGASFELLAPVGRIVREDRPVLRWRPLAGASSYKVAVVAANFQVVAESEPLVATEWALPVALARGQVYYWQVTATLADGSQTTAPRAPAPQAKFRVLEASAADELRQLETAAPASHLARGVLYARAGLVAEAEAEFQKLVNLNPRAPVARKLLKSLKQK